jgi:hypothetical protein
MHPSFTLSFSIEFVNLRSIELIGMQTNNLDLSENRQIFSNMMFSRGSERASKVLSCDGGKRIPKLRVWVVQHQKVVHLALLLLFSGYFLSHRCF